MDFYETFIFSGGRVQLSEAQSTVINFDHNRKIQVIACAGSGKTTTIITKIASMIEHLDIDPRSIMLTTFTRNAAKEMQERLENFIGLNAKNIWCGTFHSLSIKILNKYCPDILSERYHIDEAQFKLSYFLNSQKAEEFCNQIDYIIVDEFQDINKIQFNIIEAISRTCKGMIVVGDDDQNIYTWRGSNVSYIRDFLEIFENSKRFNLSTNYRCTHEIVEVAQHIILPCPNRIDKTMKANNKTGPKPVIRHFKTVNDELKNVCRMLNDSDVPLHKQAILTRTNGLLYAIETELTKIGILNTLISGQDTEIIKELKDNHVNLSTIHSAKGLEWEIVYMIGVHDKYLPLNKFQMDEERRLFYVAITRAKKKLVMSYSGKKEEISRFLLDVKRYYLDCEGMVTRYEAAPLKPKLIKTRYGVTELIRRLNGGDYINLKSKKIIPPLDFKETHLYSGIQCPKFVQENEIHAEFGCFVDYLIRRMLGDRFSDSGGLFDKRASSVIARVVTRSIDIFTQYETQIRTFEAESTLTNINEKIKPKSILQADEIRKIINKMRSMCKEYRLTPNQIHVTNQPGLPRDISLKSAYKAYTNEDNRWFHIIEQIFLVSKAHSVSFGRSRILYKDIKRSDLLGLMEWYRSIDNALEKKIKDHQKVVCNPSLTKILIGDADLIIDDCLVDFKNSVNNGVNMEHIVQLLCYSHLASYFGHNIKKIAIFNPMMGIWNEASIENWKGGATLEKFLINKAG